MSSLKDRLKSLSYNLGPLGLYHYLVNRTRLTVAMFHRVLPPGDAAWTTADREYTLDTDIFDECLNFFARHYSVVSLDQLEAAATGGPSLPGWPLLITFDDGWADTLTHAAPLLERRRLPAACFVISEAIDDPAACWWQNAFDIAWRTKRTDLNALTAYWKRLDLAPMPKSVPIPNPYLLGLAMVADLPPSARSALVDQWLTDSERAAPRQMLTTHDLATLRDSGVAIGSHGMSHVPMTQSRYLSDELTRSRLDLEAALGRTGAPQRAVDALSFPHGRLDAEIVDAARAAGYRFMFNSAPCLNDLAGGRPATDVLGRIEVAGRHVAPHGEFRADLLACHLFLRPLSKSATETIAVGALAVG